MSNQTVQIANSTVNSTYLQNKVNWTILDLFAGYFFLFNRQLESEPRSPRPSIKKDNGAHSLDSLDFRIWIDIRCIPHVQWVCGS